MHGHGLPDLGIPGTVPIPDGATGTPNPYPEIWAQILGARKFGRRRKCDAIFFDTNLVLFDTNFSTDPNMSFLTQIWPFLTHPFAELCVFDVL